MTTLSPNADGKVSGTCMAIVKTSLIVFGVLGVFGNFHIVLATYLHKSLRSKCGLLLAILACCDLWCLAFELFSAVRLLTQTSTMTRSRCFWSTSSYVIIENLEAYMLFVLGCDRLMAICFPFKYRVIPTKRYIATLIAPGVIYSFMLFILSAINMNNDMIPVCTLPLAYPGDISRLWNTLTIAGCVMTLLVYFLTYLMLYKFAPKTTDSAVFAQINIQKIVVNTLAINVAAYAVSSLLSAAIIFAIRQMGFDASVVADAETYAVIPGLLSYASNYYVYFWRSSEYQAAFKKQLFFGCLFKKKKNSLFMVASKVNKV